MDCGIRIWDTTRCPELCVQARRGRMEAIGIGFRVEPRCVHWAVVRGSAASPVLVAVDTINAPKDYSEVQTLTYFRDRVLTLIREYMPCIAGIRYPETLVRGKMEPLKIRSRIEGVIAQACDERKLAVRTGSLKTIGARLGSGNPKDYLVSDDLRGLDWSQLNPKRREAVLAAASTLPIEEEDARGSE